MACPRGGRPERGLPVPTSAHPSACAAKFREGSAAGDCCAIAIGDAFEVVSARCTHEARPHCLQPLEGIAPISGRSRLISRHVSRRRAQEARRAGRDRRRRPQGSERRHRARKRPPKRRRRAVSRKRRAATLWVASQRPRPADVDEQLEARVCGRPTAPRPACPRATSATPPSSGGPPASLR